MEDAEEVISFDQCPLEKVVVFINGYAEVRRRATVRLNLGPTNVPQPPPRSTSPLLLSPQLQTKQSANNHNNIGSQVNLTRPGSPNTRRSVAGVTTRRHSVVVRGLPGACLAADSLRVELIDYKATAPISLDDVQLVYPQAKQSQGPGADGKLEPSMTLLLEQQSLRDQMAHVRRRYESALARKHRLLAQRTILDRVADSMSRGTGSMTPTLEIYGGASSSIYADPQSLNASNNDNYRHVPMSASAYPGLGGVQMMNGSLQTDPSTGHPNSFMPTPHFIDALQGFLQLYDDRTHKVDDALADTNVELEHLQDQLNHLSSLCSDADLRAPSPHLLVLTLSHFVIHSNMNASISNLSTQVIAEEPRSSTGRLSPAGGAMLSSSNSQIATVTLSITYTVYGAFWNPAYELRLRPDDSAVQLVYSVAITQSTGEDWQFEREGNEDFSDGRCTRLLVSTSQASISPAAPVAPTPDRIFVRTANGLTARKIDQMRARTNQRMSMSSVGPSVSNQRLTPQQQAQLGLSTPNLQHNLGDYRRLSANYLEEQSVMNGININGLAQQSPAMYGSCISPASMRPFSASSLNHLYGGNPVVMYNDTNAPDMMGNRYPYRAPIQHASSFAAFVTPGHSMTTLVPNSTGDYDNCASYAAPGSEQQFLDGDSSVPSGIVFEADVLSACSATPPSSGSKTVQYVLSSGATVQIPLPKQDQSRVVVVKVPTVRQAALTPVKFVVGCHDLEVLSLSYEATPRLASSAFARAHLRNTSPLPLLAGSVAVFHDRASGSALFAYRTQLPYVSVGDDFLVALGPDPAVAIDYQAPQRRIMASNIPGKLTENLDDVQPGTSPAPRHRSKESGWKWASASSRSRSHDASIANLSRRSDIEDAENGKRAVAVARWTYYRQLIGITNRHERAVVRVHLTEPLPRPADNHLRLVLEAPTLVEVDKQIENGKKIRTSRKAKFKPKADEFVAKLNSSHQLEWDVILRAGETRYLEVRYRLELKPGSSNASHGRHRQESSKVYDSLSRKHTHNIDINSQLQQQHLQPTSAAASSSLPRSLSAQPPRPTSPYNMHQNTASPTVGNPSNSQAPSTVVTPLARRPVSSLAPYQNQPINSASTPQYRASCQSTNVVQEQQQQQYQQRGGGIRYTAC